MYVKCTLGVHADEDIMISLRQKLALWMYAQIYTHMDNMRTLGSGPEKKIRKNCALLTNQGGGKKKRKKANLYFGKVFFQWASYYMFRWRHVLWLFSTAWQGYAVSQTESTHLAMYKWANNICKTALGRLGGPSLVYSANINIYKYHTGC